VVSARGVVAGVLTFVLALSVTACGAPDDETTPPRVTTTLPPALPTALADLPVGHGDVRPGDRVSARHSILRVGSRIIRLAPLRVDGFAVVPGGVYFGNGSELWFTDLSRARATPYTDVRSLLASGDGGRIAFLDLQHGAKDRFGTPLAISIVYDAITGSPVVASYAGMGDVTSDDLAELYRKGQPAILGFDGEDLLVHGATGQDYRIPLDGSRPERLASAQPQAGPAVGAEG
jgi:hypothetical protein